MSTKAKTLDPVTESTMSGTEEEFGTPINCWILPLRSIHYAKVDRDLRTLLAGFGPSRKSYHPEYPFWRLQKDGLWEWRCRSLRSPTEPPGSMNGSWPSKAGPSDRPETIVLSGFDVCKLACSGGLQGIFQAPRYTIIIHLADPAVHGLVDLCRSHSHALPEVGLDIMQNTKILSQVELAWERDRIGVVLLKDETTARIEELGWRVYTPQEAMQQWFDSVR